MAWNWYISTPSIAYPKSEKAQQPKVGKEKPHFLRKNVQQPKVGKGQMSYPEFLPGKLLQQLQVLYSLRNHIIPKKTTIGDQEPQGCRPSGSWSPDSCQVRNCVIFQWVWVLAFIPWPMGMRVTLGIGELLISEHPISPLILTQVMG